MAEVTQQDRARVNSMARINARHRARYISKLTKLRRKTIKHVTTNMKGSVSTLAKNAAKLVSEPYLKGFYTDLYTNVGNYWAKNTYNELVSVKADIKDAVWANDLSAWINANTGEKISTVTGTLKDWVQSIVQDFVDKAVEEGLGLEELTQLASEHLAGQYTGYELWKVRQIVSQEVLSSFSVAQELGAKASEVPFIKIWIHSGSGHPHVNHVKLNGTQSNRDGNFDVGGTLAPYPRAGNLPASESISCMCTVLYRPVR